MARRKAEAVEAPQSLAEATQLAADYVKEQRRVFVHQLRCQQKIDRIKAGCDAVVIIAAVDQQRRFASLKAWWEAGGKDLAGKKRSAELAGALLGIRLTPPAVKFAKGWNAAKVLEWLGGLRWLGKSRFYRTKVELDRQAIIKHFGEADVARTLRTVLDVVQTDEFFIDTQLDEAAIAAELTATTKE